MARRQHKLSEAIAMGLSLLLAFSCTASFSAGADDEALNAALAQIVSAESLTVDLHIVIRQNGAERMRGDINCQAGKESEYVRMLITGADMSARDVEMSTGDGTRMIRVGDDFFSMPVNEGEPAANDLAALAILNVDQLRGALKELFGSVAEKMTVSDAGLCFHITENEVPSFLNFMVGFADGYVLEEGEEGDRWPASLAASIISHGTRKASAEKEVSDCRFFLPLGYGLNIDHMDLEIPMAHGAVDSLTLEIALEGKSADGDALHTALVLSCRFSDVNMTVPATVDATGVAFAPLERDGR